MKILCVIDSLVSGGAQRQMVELAKGFKDKGHEVKFLNYHKINFFKDHLDVADIPVRTIEESNYIKRLFMMRSAIRKENPDAVIAFLQSASFIATLSGFPKRKWVLVLGERNGNPSIARSWKIRFFKFFHVFSDFVVGNSHKTIDLVKKSNPFIPFSKYRVIYNIVQLPMLKDIEKTSTLNSKLKLVVVARYHSLKNLSGLIEAIYRLPENYKKRIVINWYGRKSGNENFISECENKINNLNLEKLIILNDAIVDVNTVYQKADFVALLSHYEGFPNTICEAMSFGKPVVVSRVSDLPLIIKEEVNGFLCDARDITSIRDAFIKALDSTEKERLEMGLQNFKLSQNLFNKEVIIEKYLNLFK